MKGIKKRHEDKTKGQIEIHFVGQIEGSEFSFDNSYIHWLYHLHFRYNNNNTIKKKDIQNQLGREMN